MVAGLAKLFAESYLDKVGERVQITVNLKRAEDTASL